MSEDTRLNIYLPKAGSDFWKIVLKGSGIVGTPDKQTYSGNATVLVDFEGNRYDSASMKRWADRVAHAADRHRTRYPTIARMTVVAEELEEIGIYDWQRGAIQVNVLAIPKLSQWLDGTADIQAELQRSW